VLDAINPVSFIAASIRPHHQTLPVTFVVVELSLVLISARPGIASAAFFLVISHFTDIVVAVIEPQAPGAVLQSVLEIPLI
jgi:hypothetical protein